MAAGGDGMAAGGDGMAAAFAADALAADALAAPVETLLDMQSLPTLFNAEQTPELRLWAEAAAQQQRIGNQQQSSSLSPAIGAPLLTASHCAPEYSTSYSSVQPHQREKTPRGTSCPGSEAPVGKRLRPIQREHETWGPFDGDGYRLTG